jgi:hypothetical protein
VTHLLAFSCHLQLILKIQGSLPERFSLNVKVYKDLHMLHQLFIPESQEYIWDSVAAMDRPNWIQGTIELDFKKFVEQKRRDALNKAAADPASWGSTMPELKKMMPPTKKASDAKVASFRGLRRCSMGIIILCDSFSE